ncbi:hypothetical protein [Phenylobacterium aquaticum]|jgi:hypothetical protein|uniref:hypothetical protein n=1 Tax=Phenylobacterium aquaticum TaxID=1763816 RepID=UPI001F5C8302|nr:hypothetical protein [Phenylobacterium aquaticum]MCI3131467.1 hypothetical protein [Phenylobacterium aquaticum]
MSKDLIALGLFSGLIGFQLKVGVAYVGLSNRIARRSNPKIYFAILTAYGAFAAWAAWDLIARLSAS